MSSVKGAQDYGKTTVNAYITAVLRSDKGRRDTFLSSVSSQSQEHFQMVITHVGEEEMCKVLQGDRGLCARCCCREENMPQLAALLGTTEGFSKEITESQIQGIIKGYYLPRLVIR